MSLVDRSEVAKVSDQGRIVCQNGGPVSGVTVRIFATNDDLQGEMVSDENGNYHFVDLRIGENCRVDFAYHDRVIIDNSWS